MIKFKTIRYKNFMSVGNSFIELPLDRNSTTLIVGRNGCGKSLMLDAITFSLFGKPYRKIKKPQLVNSINEKDCLVEIEFTIGKSEYLVRRGMKPNVFEIYKNDNLISQDSTTKDYQEKLEEQILKTNYKSFCQLVILGSSTYVPFMQLTPADRRSVVEELLDIQVFTTMNTILKQRQQNLKENYLVIESETKTLQKNIDLQKSYIQDIQRDNKKYLQEKEAKLSENEKIFFEKSKEAEDLKKEIESLEKKIEKKGDLKAKISQLEKNRQKIRTNIRSKEKEISFFVENDSCPTCSQKLSEDHVKEKTDFHKGKIESLKESLEKIEDKLEKFKEIEDKYEKIERKIFDKKDVLSDIQREVSVKEDIIKNLKSEIETLRKNKKTGVKSYKEELQTLEERYDNSEEQRKEMLESREYYDFVQTILKDSGIKSKIVAQYLPIMNNLINKYLNALNLGVSFDLDENFNEYIKSRHMDEFSYNSFSEGEKQRIDLSILFAWREIARLKNSVNTNLIFFDEIFDSSLDGAGTEDFLKVLMEITQKSNALIISHNGDTLYDKFEACIEFEKPGNFTRIKSFDEEGFSS